MVRQGEVKEFGRNTILTGRKRPVKAKERGDSTVLIWRVSWSGKGRT